MYEANDVREAIGTSTGIMDCSQELGAALEEDGELTITPVWNIKQNEILKTIDDTDAITNAAYSIANNAGAKAIITFSVSGKTTLRMARERAPVQISGLSPNIKTARKMQIVWGVNSCHSTQDAANTTEMVNIACSVVKNKNLVKATPSNMCALIMFFISILFLIAFKR